MEQGIFFDYYVTGHYARLLAPYGDPENGVYLAPAKDSSKDQSYFLQHVSQEMLKRCRFPLGRLLKSEVRQLARERGLEVAEKKDSQDFIAEEDYGPVFSDAPILEGEIVDQYGKVLGKHKGIVRYTIGQRRGLGVSVGSEPLYVISLDAVTNRVIVGPESALYIPALQAHDAIWAPGFGKESFYALVKVRLASRPAPALVVPLSDTKVRVEFETPQRAIAPGQSAAFYIPLSENPLKWNQSFRAAFYTILVGGSIIDHAIQQCSDR
jgi:tRNA-specific 2-thiouridylase